MSKEALMLKTGDNRSFFTHKKNLSLLTEFAKTFGVKVSLVKVASKETLLGIEKLVPAICDANYTSPEVFYDIVEEILPKVELERRRPVLRQNAEHIRSFIRLTLTKNKELSLRDLKRKYYGQGLTDSCFCNHFTFVRKTLAKEGFKIIKTGGGRYRLI